MKTQYQVGEIRKSPDTGNVWRLVRVADNDHYLYVTRISNGTGEPLWDADLVYYWHWSSWDLLTLVTEEESRNGKAAVI